MAGRHDGSRWRATLVLAAAGVVAASWPLAVGGVDENALRVAIRSTAGLAAVVFSIVFATSSMNALAKAGWSKWMLRNRRALGVGFAAIQAIHLVVVLTLASRYPDRFWATTPVTSIVGGGIGYAWLAAMTITSFDATAHAIGRRAWTILHKSGMYVLWAIFVFSYAAQPLSTWPHITIVVLLSAAAATRVLARARRRTRSAERNASALAS